MHKYHYPMPRRNHHEHARSYLRQRSYLLYIEGHFEYRIQHCYQWQCRPLHEFWHCYQEQPRYHDNVLHRYR